jgi:hypothetical protein
VATTEYGSKLHVWNWRERTLRQSIDLGQDGLIPLETRFFHNPQSTIGYVVRRAGLVHGMPACAVQWLLNTNMRTLNAMS